MDNYSDLVQEYKQYGRHAVTDWVLGYHKVYALLAPLNGLSLLDVGCGDGKFSRYMAERGAEVTGIDSSEGMIAAANAISRSHTLRYIHVSDRHGIASLHQQFDIITANFLTCTIHKRELLKELFQDMYDALGDGGRIILLNANWEQGNGKNFISYRLKKYDQLISGMDVEVHLKGPEPITVHDTFWSKQEYISLLNEIGFVDITSIESCAGDDSYHWIDEKTHAPMLMISAKKGRI